MSLKTLLIAETIGYTNGKIERKAQKKPGLFNSLVTSLEQMKMKADGIARAQKYKKEVIETSENDPILLNNVLDDLEATRFFSRLGSSKKYSRCLLNGICDYLEIRSGNISAEVNRRTQRFAERNKKMVVAYQYGTSPPSEDLSYETIALEFVREAMNQKGIKRVKSKEQPKQEEQSNVFRFIGNQQL